MSKEKSFKYGGVGLSKKLRDSIKGMIVLDTDTTITPTNALIVGTTDQSGWRAILAPIIATSTYEKGVFINLWRGVEVKTAERPMTTSNTGFEEQAGDVYEKMTAYGNMSYSEYLGFGRMSGKEKDIVVVLKNGNLLMTKSGTSYKGFAGRVFVNQGSLPKSGADLTKECPFDVFFDDDEEWEVENFVEVDTNFTFTQLKNINPIGLDVVVTTAYSSPNVTIKVTLRNDNTPFTGVAAAANIQIIEAVNDAVCAVSSVTQTNAAIGSYPVALTASLNGPVWARITAEGADYRTYVSKMFQIV